MFGVDIKDIKDIAALNQLIERGERFYVTRYIPECDDSLWETNYAFWGDGESQSADGPLWEVPIR